MAFAAYFQAVLTALLSLMVLPVSGHIHAADQAATRPNVVVILVDDMGFSDIGCYGSEIPTPHLDALAANGLRFTQFYNTGRCCPTRATLLTGQYSHQAGIGHMNGDYGLPGYQGYLNDQCVTFADVARSAGYFTAVTGKWHVGHRERSMWPLSRGFDRFYGIPEGGGFYFQVKEGRSVVLNDEPVATTDMPLPDGWYSTDAWSEYGLKFIDEAAAARKPFLLYLAHNAPHFPLQADAEDIARFRGKYSAGWVALSAQRHRRQVEMGIVDAAWQKAKRPPSIAVWNSLDEAARDRFDHMMAVYAACVWRMDRSIGTLVSGLKDRGVLNDTLILFMSDNGGCAESGPNGRTTGDPTTADSDWFCGESWAWMQNTPFRKYKHFNHEGGIGSPLIAHWPDGIKSPGTLCHDPAHLIDIMATVTDVSGAEYPKTHNGHDIHPLEGVSLRTAFDHQPLSREALYWEHEGNAAIRIGDWKLVRLGGNGEWELYNLKSDRTEQRNLAESEPDRVGRMAAQWAAWAASHQVHPDGLPKARNRRAAAVR